MKRLMSLPICSIALAAVPASAQMLSERLSVHPEHIAADADLLVKIQDYWPNGCGGEVSVEVEANAVLIVARPAQPSPSVGCTEAVLPFTRLVNPRDFAPAGLRWAGLVHVAYRMESGNTALFGESRTFATSDAPNKPAAVEVGSWVTPLLNNAALLIDQQESLLSATLFDYDASGRGTWSYGAARLDGNVLIAPMQRYAEVQCVTTPCPRAVPVHTGHLRMLVEGRSRIWVQFDDVLDQAPTGDAIEYTRLDFQRSPELANVGLPAPDLIGRWVGGVAATSGARGEPLPAAVGQWDVVYGGYDNDSGLPRLFFHAYAAPLEQIDGRPPATPLAWRVQCTDLRPVDGPLQCAIDNYPHPQGNCRVSFDFDAAGHSQVNARAECGGDAGDFGAGFNLFRMPPGS